MPTLLAPGEHLAGPPDHRRALAAWLTALRADPAPPARPTALTLITLAELLAQPGQPASLDIGLLRSGITIAARRYRQLGLPRMLPPGRVHVATRSSTPGTYGGFHFPGQGYRHWQMTALVSFAGLLHEPAGIDPHLAALDLLRAYAHDSLHYGSHRTYQIHPAPAGYGIARTRYGINFRRADGRTYSLPDPPGAATTRNLGTIMEGATDREATTIARHAARAAGLPEPPAGLHATAWRDTTGTLTPADLAQPTTRPATGDTSPTAYHARLTRYHRAVTAPYTTLLTELSPDNPDHLHDLILTATLTGTLTPLTRTLNQQHGPAAFTRLFKNSAYAGQTVGDQAGQPGCDRLLDQHAERRGQCTQGTWGCAGGIAG